MIAAHEPFLTIDELANVMGVSASTIRRWRAQGMPSETWGMKRTRRYQASRCIAWARARQAGMLDDADNHDLRLTTGGDQKE